MAQRLLVGQEYFVNAVSGAGAHLVTEVWRADKIPVPGGAAIYDVARLVAPATAEGRPIVAFVEAVLEALGVRWGASHTELFVTAEGPVLVESASRLSGGIDCRATGFVLGASQVDLLARLIDEGPDWVPATRAAGGLPPRQPLWNVAFRAAESGVVRTVRIEELLGRLASRSWLQKAPAPGDRLERTVDLFHQPRPRLPQPRGRGGAGRRRGDAPRLGALGPAVRARLTGEEGAEACTCRTAMQLF